MDSVDKEIRIIKKFAIFIVIFALILYFVCSLKIFNFTQDHPELYAKGYKNISKPGQVFVDTMVATGSFENSVGDFMSPARKTTSGKGYDFFGDVSSKHSK